MAELAFNMQQAADAVQRQWPVAPRLGVILGSGLGGLAAAIDAEVVLEYEDLPHFPTTTATGHQGRLVCGRLEGVPLVVFQGRFHLYEGYSAQQAALPVRLLQALGGGVLVTTNAAGGVHPAFRVGDLMLLEDQINFMFDNPLVGVHDDRLGPRFPDMSAPYDRELLERAAKIARRNDFTLPQGVYLGLLGPTYETRAEYRMVRRLGADAVGMSTIPEVVAARQAQMRVLGIATITNLGLPDAPSKTSGHEVVTAAASSAGKLTQLLGALVRELGNPSPAGQTWGGQP